MADLIGLTEIAQMLGMTRSGADKLVKREADFPQPIGVLAGRTRVWESAAVAAWIADRPIGLENAQRMEGDRPAPKPIISTRPHIGADHLFGKGKPRRKTGG